MRGSKFIRVAVLSGIAIGVVAFARRGSAGSVDDDCFVWKQAHHEGLSEADTIHARWDGAQALPAPAGYWELIEPDARAYPPTGAHTSWDNYPAAEDHNSCVGQGE